MKRHTLLLFAVAVLAVVATPATLSTVAATPTSGTVVVSGNSGPGVVVPGGRNINLTRTATDSGATRLDLENGGQLVADGDTGAALTVPSDEYLNESTVNIIGIQTSSPVTLAPSSSQDVTVGKDITSITWHDTGFVELDDGTVDFTYAGTDGTTSLVDIGGVQSDVIVAAVDANTGDVLDLSQSSAAGRVNFTDLPNSEHDVTLQTYETSAPTASNPSPNATETNNENVDLSVDVKDGDFSYDDEVNVTFVLDGSELTTKTITSNQTVTANANGLGDGSHDWHVEMEDSYGETTTSDTYSFTVNHYSADVSDISPTGRQSTNPSTVSAQINDTDFAEPSGDSVSVDIIIDGSTVDTQTLTSNGTVSASIPDSGLTGGEHNVTIATEDEYGLTNSRQDSYLVPYNLTIYNESASGNQVEITSTATVSVRFFSESGDVYERTTSDGTISLEGLPVNEQFVVEASANGYHDRRIVLDSIYHQESVYLLPTTVTSDNIVYGLEDNTGQFSPADESILFVEKPLNVSGSVEYRVVTSDYFSAAGEVTATLENSERYRLRLRGPDGDQRILGAYRTAGDDSALLTVGNIRIGNSTAENPAFQSFITNESGQRVLKIYYRDPANATTGLQLQVVNANNESEIIRPKTTESGRFGTYIETVLINDTDKSYKITYAANRTGYPNENGTRYAGTGGDITDTMGVDSAIMSMLGYLLIVAVLGMTAITYPRYAGVPTVAVATALSTLGVLTIHPLLLSGAGVVALLFAVGGERL